MDSDAEDQPVNGEPRRPSPTPLDLFATGCALLLPIAFSPSVFASFWTPKAAILLLVAAVGLPRLLQLCRQRDGSAIAATLFVLWAGVSTALSSRPVLAVTGSYNSGTGLLFYLALTGAWAIGRSLSARGRSAALGALLLGLGITAVAAIAQTAVDLSEFQLGRSLDRADAFMGNPVHLGAAMAGAIGAASWYWIRRTNKAALVGIVLFACALQLSGSRFALVAAVLALVAAARRGPVLRVGAAIFLLVAGLGCGSLVGRVASAPTGTTRAVANASSGLTPRIEMAKAALRAVADRPISGSGPGRFREATGRYRTLRMATSEGPDRLFTDAHNVVLEVAVATGLPGLLLAGAWMVLAARKASGPYGVLAFGVLVLVFVQPLSVSTVPIGVLALGLARPLEPPARGSRATIGLSAVLSVAALLCALLLFIGDFDRLQAQLDFDRPHGQRSADLLGFWPEPHQLLSKIVLYESIVAVPDDERLLREAIRLQGRACRADPWDPQLWNELGLLELRLRDFEMARRHFQRALRSDPQSLNGWIGVGQAAMATQDYDGAVIAFTQASRRATTADQRRFVQRRLEQAKSQPGAV